MAQCLFNLVDEDQTQVTRVQPAQSRVDGIEFALNFLHVTGFGCPIQPFAQQAQHLAVGAAALAGVFVQQHIVKHTAQNGCLLGDVFVTAVTRTADDHAAAFGRHAFHCSGQGRNGIRVVTIVGNDGGTLVVKRVEAETQSAGGIYIPDNVAQKPDQGIVLAVGLGRRTEEGTIIPMSLKENDQVLFGKNTGELVKIEGEELLVLKESEIFAVIEEN